jgi:DNA-binding MarR family transcriptional regulator
MATEGGLNGLKAINDAWRVLHSEVQAQTVATFYAIAANPGLSHTKLQETLGVAQSTVSRNVNYLSAEAKFGVKGLGLVLSQDNPRNRRQKLVTLTPKGQNFLNTLLALL